ncbi:MAG: type VI secretion system protein TssA [Lysobacter sp.]
MLDQDDLLAPIPGADPVGEDLSFSLDYDAIQEARRADDPSLEQGEWVTDLKVADWPAVERLCTRLLRERSKDLQLAVWWCEAQTRNHGFAGLARGFRLVAGLCDRYWDDIHPQVEDDDLEQRIGNLGWLTSHSVQWLRQLPLTYAPQGRFGLADFEAARAGRDEGDSRPTPEALDAARRNTPHEFYVRLAQLAPDCRDALDTLERAVDARLGRDGPAFTALRDQLEHLEATTRRFAREAGVLMEGQDATADTGDHHPPVPATASVPSRNNDAVSTRKEAIAQLRRVAEFFRRTEPHSPVAYLADKAARWGEMPLHVWLKRVIKDDATLALMEEMLEVPDPTAAQPD